MVKTSEQVDKVEKREELEQLIRMLHPLCQINQLEQEAKRGFLSEYYGELMGELEEDYQFQKEEYWRLYG